MTAYFHYDDMTWDAVAELPRDTPLVLPLGSGYDTSTLLSTGISTPLSATLSLLADQVSQPPRIGLLPPFPFGWRGSGLEVPEPIFLQYISNLLDSLRDDGFSRVYCLAPSGIDRNLFSSNNFQAPACVSRIHHIIYQ